jgi:hypothetical protein
LEGSYTTLAKCRFGGEGDGELNLIEESIPTSVVIWMSSRIVSFARPIRMLDSMNWIDEGGEAGAFVGTILCHTRLRLDRLYSVTYEVFESRAMA